MHTEAMEQTTMATGRPNQKRLHYAHGCVMPQVPSAGVEVARQLMTEFTSCFAFLVPIP
jgi:hypothetical protein